MNTLMLRDAVSVRGRFHRSVQVARDWKDRQHLQEYLLTPTARELAIQIIRGLQTPKGIRAWSITGPYGTGKSAFALFLTDLLAQVSPDHPQGRTLRHSLAFEAPAFVPVLCVGQRAPLVRTFLAALAEAVEQITPEFAQVIYARAESGHVSDIQLTSLIEQVAYEVKAAGHSGLLLILDEFGKFLEYAALHSDSEDLLVMQHLAETAARSPIPIVLVTILHTGFADYLDTVDDIRRREWQKVQGRFADVAFQEPPEQLLRLVNAAIGRELPARLNTAYEDAADQIIQSPPLTEVRHRFPTIEELIPGCAPLHPVTALLLWPLFRSKLAQNERSLFAFLTGHEPFGFQQFLSVSTWNHGAPPFYRVDQLYDYVVTALGASIYRGDHARRWAEIGNAGDRILANAPPLALAVVKAVGLLGLYGAAVGLRASEELLGIALGDPAAVRIALTYLQNTSILVYRKHEGAYGLWEGSDVDLESCIAEARLNISQGKLATRLKQIVNPRPIVARAHYIKTGTLRHFRVDIIDGSIESLRAAIGAPFAPADGQTLYVLVPNVQERQTLINEALELTAQTQLESHLRIIAFPKPIVGLEDALREVESWTWVRENTPGLQGDPVAKQEVAARIQIATEHLENTAGIVLGLRGYAMDATLSEWIQGGATRTPPSARRFLEWLSQLCSEVYSQAPVLLNELLNRDRLSSAAARARRNLLEAMLYHEREVNLGFEGYPPEISMYRSLLQEGGFHTSAGGQLSFGKPGEKWQPVWLEIHRFLEATHVHRRPIKDLITLLKQPPFGLREGPIPVVLCTILLAHRDDVALYDGGVFVPELRIEVLERLFRIPDVFEIQQFLFSEEDREAFAAIGQVVDTVQTRKDQQDELQLLQVVKPLVTFAASLPPYTKNTKRINPPEALAVRNSLLKSSDPYRLLFVDLPKVMGLSSLGEDNGEGFPRILKECLLGLQRAYPQLLNEIENQVRDVFDLPQAAAEACERLRARARVIEGNAADQALALFIREAGRLDNSRDWREVLGRVVINGTPPHQWRDPDTILFQVKLRQLASDFIRVEELVAEQQQTGATEILRIGLLNNGVQELRGVVAVTPERAVAIEHLADRVVQLLEEQPTQSEEDRRVRIAVLARVAARYLQDNGGDKQ